MKNVKYIGMLAMFAGVLLVFTACSGGGGGGNGGTVNCGLQQNYNNPSCVGGLGYGGPGGYGAYAGNRPTGTFQTGIPRAIDAGLLPINGGYALGSWLGSLGFVVSSPNAILHIRMNTGGALPTDPTGGTYSDATWWITVGGQNTNQYGGNVQMTGPNSGRIVNENVVITIQPGGFGPGPIGFNGSRNLRITLNANGLQLAFANAVGQ